MKKLAVFFLATIVLACHHPKPLSPSKPLNSDPTKAMEEIKLTISGGDCATGLTQLSEYSKKFGSDNSEIYWQKAYCFRNTNPDSACAAYDKYISLTQGGGQSTNAAKYIN